MHKNLVLSLVASLLFSFLGTACADKSPARDLQLDVEREQLRIRLTDTLEKRGVRLFEECRQLEEQLSVAVKRLREAEMDTPKRPRFTGLSDREVKLYGKQLEAYQARDKRPEMERDRINDEWLECAGKFIETGKEVMAARERIRAIDAIQPPATRLHELPPVLAEEWAERSATPTLAPSSPAPTGDAQ
jgi:hypothetical protein